MAHAHDHSHGDRNQFYLEQLFTILVCAAFAGVTLILYATGGLNIFLHPKFHIWVLLGGGTLLAMAVVNGVAVWLSVGTPKPHDHAHDHGHDTAHDHDHDHAHDHAHGNGHDHASCDHDHHDHAACDHHDHVLAHVHDHVHAHEPGHAHTHAHGETAVQAAAAVAGVQPHAAPVPAAATAAVAAPPPVAHAHGDGHGHDGHNHGWAPLRYAVLLLPVAIYFLVPLEALAGPEKPIDVDPSKVSSVEKGEDFSITFQQLELAALYSENRGFYEGKTVQLVGQYVPKDNHMFTLRRYKISCCAADAVGLNAVILIDPEYSKQHPKDVLDGSRLQGRWVQVTGRVQFLKRADASGGYATTLILLPTAGRPLLATQDGLAEPLVKEVPPPANPYL